MVFALWIGLPSMICCLCRSNPNPNPGSYISSMDGRPYLRTCLRLKAAGHYIEVRRLYRHSRSLIGRYLTCLSLDSVCFLEIRTCHHQNVNFDTTIQHLRLIPSFSLAEFVSDGEDTMKTNTQFNATVRTTVVREVYSIDQTLSMVKIPTSLAVELLLAAAG